MVRDSPERLRRELTDKFVLVIGDRPEHARFVGFVGQVKTVNQSGRALVQFTGFLNNVAWFDLDPACLRVIDKPAEEGGAAKKAAPTPASKVPAKGARPSAAEVLAAVRGGAPASAKADAAGRAPGPTPATPAPRANAAKKVSPSVTRSTADILAAARESSATGAPKASPPKKPAPSGMSGMTTEEILAAARAAKKPAADAPKASALDTLDGPAAAGPQPRRLLSAADIRDIGAGKLALRREAPIASNAVPKKALPPTETPQIAALPKKIDRTKLSAADILAMGLRK